MNFRWVERIELLDKQNMPDVCVNPIHTMGIVSSTRILFYVIDVLFKVESAAGPWSTSVSLEGNFFLAIALF